MISIQQQMHGEKPKQSYSALIRGSQPFPLWLMWWACLKFTNNRSFPRFQFSSRCTVRSPNKATLCRECFTSRCGIKAMSDPKASTCSSSFNKMYHQADVLTEIFPIHFLELSPKRRRGCSVAATRVSSNLGGERESFLGGGAFLGASGQTCSSLTECWGVENGVTSLLPLFVGVLFEGGDLGVRVGVLWDMIADLWLTYFKLPLLSLY